MEGIGQLHVPAALPLCPRNLTVRRINPVTQSGDKPLPHMPLWRGAEWSIGLWKRSGYWCCIRINSKWWSWKVLPSVGSIPHYEEVGLCVGITNICIVSAMCFAVLDCRLRKGRWVSVVRGSSGRVGVLAAKTVIFFSTMCLLTIMYKVFLYRTVFAKTAFLFATCCIGKFYYPCVYFVMLQ